MSKNKQQHQNGTKTSMDTSGTEIRQVKTIPDLMSCVFTHRTSSTTADFRWTGQPLNAVWPTVLAFLKWSHDTYKSESQVRLFVNRNTREWAAWAFPQESRIGMATREINEGHAEYEKTKVQRARFSDTDGWYYWGTVHHHCSSSAFQSSTDRNNEENQDGIHITVGYMDRNQFDIDFRIYVGGFKLRDVTPLDFWDTGNEIDTVPPRFRSLLPSNTEELLAKSQMGTPPPPNTEFPEVWKENIIDLTPKAVVSHPTSGAGVRSGGSHVGAFGKTYSEKADLQTDFDLNKGHRLIKELLHSKQGRKDAIITEMEDVIKSMEELDRLLHREIMDIFAVCVESECYPSKLAEFIVEQEAELELREQLKLQHSEGGHQPPQTVHNAGQPGQAHLPNDPNHWYYGHM